METPTGRPASSAHPTEPAACHHHTTPQVQTAVDPVCGMTVDAATARTAPHDDGTTVYFCSTGCATTFAAHPDRYAAAPAHHT